MLPAIFKANIDLKNNELEEIYKNFSKISKYFSYDKKIANLYFILLKTATRTIENKFLNFLIVKKYLCMPKKEFSKVKILERNLCLLKKINEKMSVEDAIFLVRHMKEDYELSFLIYLMSVEDDDEQMICKELEGILKGVDDRTIGIEKEDAIKLNYEKGTMQIKNNKNLLLDVHGNNSCEDDNQCLKYFANKNKNLVLHIINIIHPYKNQLFSTKFEFNGHLIYKNLKINKNEMSFYLKMAKAQQIVHKVESDKVFNKLKEIQKAGRINGFVKFHLTNIF